MIAHTHSLLIKNTFFLINLLLVTSYLKATTTDFSASADSYIVQNAATTNYGAVSEMYSYPWTGSSATRRALVKFDLSSIPSGSVISSATLTLMETSSLGATRTVGAHRLTKNWTNGGVTWNKFDGTTDWTAGGGDYNAATSTNVISWSGLKADTWDVTTDVNNIVNSAGNNYGWLMKDESEDDSQEYWGFGTSDNGTAGNRPKLTVVYVLPVTFLKCLAKAFQDYTQVKWLTATESNNDYFTIERSVSPLAIDAFTKIATVKGNGTSNEILTYNYTDITTVAGGLYYYRIKQTDFDGKFDYSPVFYATSCNENEININVSTSNGVTSFTSNGFGINILYELYSNTGALIASKNAENFQYTLIPNQLYIIKVTDGIIEKEKKIIVY